MSVNIPEIFACNVFNEDVMKTRLPKNVYKALKRTMQNNEPLADMETADVVANTIKEWAIERGATHYTHWFQPMTGSTAEKHDCFINPAPNGMALMEFSGKALVKGEPDASSFPSGGLRRTSSARGYTAWDPTSYCFVKEGSLYIPTVFVSYTGEVLDKKTPLLRSMQALSKTAVRFLKLFGNDRVTRVTSTVGAEQEYFLIDKKMFDQREDLILTGRTCLLHEKPFEGVNGSGKHNNWSMSTNDGQNLLDPGDTPMDNLQFLTILCALIKGVDEYADLMRLSAASAGNDHRLGADEAPPAIVSMFLGEELEAVLQAIEDDEVYKTKARAFKIGVDALPSFPKDSTDRNRTSPFAFTGNRFEFRMVGSSDNIACPNVLLNTIMCEELSQFTEILEPFKGKDNFDAEVRKLLKSVIKEHRRIIFNGDGYSAEWVKEAERRGLPNYVSTVDCMPHYTDEKNVRIFRKFEIYNQNEVAARTEIHLEKYSKTIRIEARTMVEMARKQLLPATMEHVQSLCEAIATKKSIGFTCNTDEKIAKKLNELADRFYESIERLEQRIAEANAVKGIQKQAEFFHDVVLAEMDIMRNIADEIELNMPAAKWPIPAYSEIIYNV